MSDVLNDWIKIRDGLLESKRKWRTPLILGCVGFLISGLALTETAWRHQVSWLIVSGLIMMVDVGLIANAVCGIQKCKLKYREVEMTIRILEARIHGGDKVEIVF